MLAPTLVRCQNPVRVAGSSICTEPSADAHPDDAEKLGGWSWWASGYFRLTRTRRAETRSPEVGLWIRSPLEIGSPRRSSPAWSAGPSTIASAERSTPTPTVSRSRHRTPDATRIATLDRRNAVDKFWTQLRRFRLRTMSEHGRAVSEDDEPLEAQMLGLAGTLGGACRLMAEHYGPCRDWVERFESSHLGLNLIALPRGRTVARVQSGVLATL
jgi:hypothetical protein